MFDFILILNYTDFSDKTSDIETNVKVAIDILTIIVIHIIVTQEKQVQLQDTSSFLLPSTEASFLLQQRQNRVNYLAAKLVKLDLFTILINLISIKNLTLREHSIKILQLMINASPEFNSTFKNNSGFEILAMMIRKQSDVSSMSLCQTVINSILGIYDNPNDMRPPGHTVVQ